MNVRLFFTITAIIIVSVYSLIQGQTEEYGSLSGRVSDSATGEGIPNAGVYVSGTMTGTLTDSKGKYTLKKVPAGPQSVIASIIGYSPQIGQIDFKSGVIVKHDFFLSEHAIEMNIMQISAKSSREWLKNLKIFKKYLLSRTELTEKSIIQNEAAINFKENTPGMLEAECPCPLVIINKEYGYRIDCTLQKFTYKARNDKAEIVFVLEAFSLKTDNDEIRERWKSGVKNVFYFE